MVYFKRFRRFCSLFIYASISLFLPVGLCITSVANATPLEYQPEGETSVFKTLLSENNDATQQDNPDQPNYNFYNTTTEMYNTTCTSADKATCEDQVRPGHLGADGPLWLPFGLPIPYHNQDVRECAVRHDFCYIKQVPGAGPDCDRDLFNCLLKSGSLPEKIIGLPYNVIMSLIFEAGVAQACAYQNVERDCRCDFSPPESEIQRLAKNIWATQSLTIKHSECCNSSGECKPAGSTCKVELKTQHLGSFVTSTKIFEGRCVQDSKVANN